MGSCSEQKDGLFRYLVRHITLRKCTMLSEPKLYPAHVCKACGQEMLRSEMDAPMLLSGVVECPACGSSGALNIEIRSLEDRKPPVRSNGKL
jgi:hypothetical protein